MHSGSVHKVDRVAVGVAVAVQQSQQFANSTVIQINPVEHARTRDGKLGGYVAPISPDQSLVKDIPENHKWDFEWAEDNGCLLLEYVIGEDMCQFDYCGHTIPDWFQRCDSSHAGAVVYGVDHAPSLGLITVEDDPPGIYVRERGRRYELQPQPQGKIVKIEWMPSLFYWKP